MKSLKHIICIILCFGLFLFAHGQNLVSNWSFEDTLSCPDNGGQINRAIGWNTPTIVESSDLYNSCASFPFGLNNVLGNQIPKTGNGYAGIYTYYQSSPTELREYIQSQLLDSLKSNTLYCVSFYTSLAEDMKFNCNNIGIYFSSDSINTPDTVLFYPSQVNNSFSNSLNDKNNWTMVSGTFTAVGGEKYLSIGNFDLPSNLDTTFVGGGLINGAYYYIDDISVEEIAPVDAGSDTLVNSADSVQVGNNPTENATYVWQPATGLSDTNAANPMVWVENTTTYVVTKTQCNVVTTDTVVVNSSVGISELPVSNYEFSLYPNPSKGEMKLDYHLDHDENGELIIYSATGKEMNRYTLNNNDKQLLIDNQELSDGVYFYQIVVNGIAVKQDKLVITK